MPGCYSYNCYSNNDYSYSRYGNSSYNNRDLFFIDLLHHAQLHNADQLSDFLLHFVARNFEAFEKTEQFQKLTGENLSFVKSHQWQSFSYSNAKNYEESAKNGEESAKNNNKNCILM